MTRRSTAAQSGLLPCSVGWLDSHWHLAIYRVKSRLFNVLDDCTSECLCIEVSTGFSGAHVARLLERLCQGRAEPECIRSDNGPRRRLTKIRTWVSSRRRLCWLRRYAVPRRASGRMIWMLVAAGIREGEVPSQGQLGRRVSSLNCRDAAKLRRRHCPYPTSGRWRSSAAAAANDTSASTAKYR